MSCSVSCFWLLFFFFKQKTAYEMRISDWSSDVCSSDLVAAGLMRARASQNDFLAKAVGTQSLMDLRDTDLGRTTRVFGAGHRKIGRASCRERVCQYV